MPTKKSNYSLRTVLITEVMQFSDYFNADLNVNVRCRKQLTIHTSGRDERTSTLNVNATQINE